MGKSNPNLRVEYITENPRATDQDVLVYCKEFCEMYEQKVNEGKIPYDAAYQKRRDKGELPAEEAFRRLDDYALIENEFLRLCESAQLTMLPVNLIKPDVYAIENGLAFEGRKRKMVARQTSTPSPNPGSAIGADHILADKEKVIKEKDIYIPTAEEDPDAFFNAEVAAELEYQSQCPYFDMEDSFITIETAAEAMNEAAKTRDPVLLWKKFWIEGEICCLFADTNIGKSIYAVQIAEHISQFRKVLYLDFEMSRKQFSKRYTDDNGVMHEFNPNFIRGFIDSTKLKASTNVEDEIILRIEQAATHCHCDTVIIDNITYLCNDSISAEAAGNLMMKLVDLKNRRKFSILVLGHTKKRDATLPLTANDLAGSKRIINFLDAAFCIGVSVRDNEIRYIKEIKNRQFSIMHGEDNVILCEITKDDGWLHFRERGFGKERALLREPKDGDERKLEESVKTLRDGGMSFRDIGRRLGISHMKAKRICDQSAKEEQDDLVKTDESSPAQN